MPERYVGLWRRLSLEDAAGQVDRSTEVYWLQTHGLYADLRVPMPRPAFARGIALTAMTPAQQQWLATQQGFAGTLELAGRCCTWHRTLDYQPATGVPDTGKTRFEDDGLLIEEGVHTPYREVWQRMADGGAVLGLELMDETLGDEPPQARRGVWVAVGDYFIHAIDRPQPLPAAGALLDLLAMRGPESGAPFLGCEISFGLRAGGRCPWEICLSTLPGREGTAVVDPLRPPALNKSGVCVQRIATLSGTLTRRWRLRELSGGFRWLD
ncbi:MAG: hypothetical protein WCC36_06110 [Gammaproteobacteria bacterium]